MENKNISDYKERRSLVYKQLSLDYCCDAEEIENGKDNIFSVYKPLEGRRRYEEQREFVLKAISVKGKLVATGRKDVITALRKKYAKEDAAWFMEPESMKGLNSFLAEYGCHITHLHPFYVAYEPTKDIKTDYEIRLYEREDIEGFRGDKRFSNAFTFKDTAPDEIGVGAFEDEKIMAMAGASSDSDYLWQIGIDVLPEHRGKGLGKILVTSIKNEILKRGRVPYYGTAFSHTLSQNIAIASGFHAGWTELYAEPDTKEK